MDGSKLVNATAADITPGAVMIAALPSSLTLTTSWVDVLGRAPR